MPYRRIPNSMPAVLRTLKTARDTYKTTPIAAERAITAEQFAKLDDANANSLLSRLLKEASDVDLAQAAQAPLTTQLAQTAARLTMFVSHFHQVLDLGIARGTFAAGARSFYGRDVHATAIPDLATYDAVADAAEKIGAGETARSVAEGAGYRPMDLPNASEIAVLSAQFDTLRAQSRQAQTHTDTQREEAGALYPEAQALAVDLCDTVEFFYRKDPDPASRRAKCVRWGVVYIYESDQVPDAVTNTRVTALGGGKLHVTCDPAPRAATYQFWVQVVGTDADFRLAASADEPDNILEGFTAGATVKVKLRAVNAAGEGPFGEEQQIGVT
jgi:hypothetical protein